VLSPARKPTALGFGRMLAATSVTLLDRPVGGYGRTFCPW
jgi:hypothetical protein